ncbi:MULTISPECIES: PAAR-like domain-containing protein [unclassified Neorhizobium]|uniref:PAAR-like domain-containing protein n=1 Tax=unclassified Neorhizobium TaxID=2629175 RepID=UPI00155EDF97|nr:MULTISPECIES: PAAR-like domain-containing protein [unclassified Neorhizobium]
MPFVNSQGPIPGMDFSVPDVYLQPTPVGPIPVPFMSMGMRATEIPTNFRFLICCMPSHNMMNIAPVTISGPGPGVASGMVCSNSRNVKGSVKLIIQAAPATRALMDPTVQNGVSPNSVGTTIVPSQVRFLNPSG